VLNPGALTCGANPGSPVTDDYASPFKLTAAVHRRNGGRQRRADPLNEAEPRVHMARRQATGEPYPRNTPQITGGVTVA
jgi:arylsulfatase